jgi:lysozyme family protein
MAFFKRALPTIWLHEGRFSDNPNDPGGPTNYGISLQFLMKCGDLDKDGWKDGDINHDGEVNAEDIRKLDQQTAENLYYLYFWKKNDYEILSSQNNCYKNNGLMYQHGECKCA